MPAFNDDASGLDGLGDDETLVSTVTTTAEPGSAESDGSITLYIVGLLVVLCLLWAINIQIGRRCTRHEPSKSQTPPGQMLNKMTLGSLPNDVDTDLEPQDTLGLRLIDETKAD